MNTPDVATHAEQRIDELRHEAVRRATMLLRYGDARGALAIMRSSVEHQAWLAGVDVDLPVPS